MVLRYSTVIHLWWYYSTMPKKFTIYKFSITAIEYFWGLILKYAYIWHLQAYLWMLLIFYFFTFKCNKYKEFDGTNLLMNLIILCELIWNFTNEGLTSKISKSKLMWEIIKKEEIVMHVRFHVMAKESTRFDKGRETFLVILGGGGGGSHDSC